MKDRDVKKGVLVACVLACFVFLAGSSVYGSLITGGGECGVEGGYSHFEGKTMVCRDGLWRVFRPVPAGRGVVYAESRSNQRPYIVSSDENCSIEKVGGLSYRLVCGVNMAKKPFSKLAKQDNVEVYSKARQVRFTYNKLEAGTVFKVGEHSTVVNVTQGWTAQPRCFSLDCNPANWGEDGFAPCSSDANYYVGLRHGDSGGSGSGAYYADVIGFNISELDGPVSDAEICVYYYSTAYTPTYPRHFKWQYECDLTDTNQWVDDNWVADYVVLEEGADVGYACANLSNANIDWSQDCISFFLHTNGSGYCDGVDSYGVIKGANDANPPYISYDVGQTTTTTVPTTTTVVTTTTTLPTTTTSIPPTTTIIQDIWVDEDGDTMSGPLDMDEYDITDVGSINIVDGFSCAGCVDSSDVGFTYAASATQGGAATQLECPGCVGVSDIGSIGACSSICNDSTDDSVSSGELDNLCFTDGKILKRVSGTWDCANDDDTPDANEVTESMLNAVNSPTDEYVLTYESSSGKFEWEADANTLYSDGNGIGLSGTQFYVSGGEGVKYESNGVAFDCSEVTDTTSDHIGCSGENLVVSDEWVNTNGDTMSGNLNMNGKDILNVDEIKGSSEMTLKATNNINLDGTVRLIGSCRIEGASCDSDIAENMHSKASKEAGVSGEFESGDVVCVDLNNPKQIKFCDGEYDTNVLSVVNYGATQFIGDPSAPYPVSLKGIVPVKVDCSTPIKAGDMLVTAEKPGYAQSIKTETPQNLEEMWSMLVGTQFAKALEPCDSGKAIIKTWLT